MHWNLCIVHGTCKWEVYILISSPKCFKFPFEVCCYLSANSISLLNDEEGKQKNFTFNKITFTFIVANQTIPTFEPKRFETCIEQGKERRMCKNNFYCIFSFCYWAFHHFPDLHKWKRKQFFYELKFLNLLSFSKCCFAHYFVFVWSFALFMHKTDQFQD